MRLPLVLLAATALTACAVSDPGTPPDTTRFYYPTGIGWLPDTDGGGPGFLYVVSSDFDLRFNRGTIASVDVASLEPLIAAALVTLADPDAGAVAVHTDDPYISNIVTIDPFGGPLASYVKPDGTPRLFVVGRESNVLQGVDVTGPVLACAQSGVGSDCFTNSVVLATSQLNQSRDAYRPLVATDGNVYVSHITPIDHPYGSNTNFTATVAVVNAMTLGTPGFAQIGIEASDGLAQVGGLLYIGGRAFASDTNVTPLRRLQLASPGTTVVDTGLPAKANVLDGRALATSSDGTSLYMVVRDPDALLTLDMTPGIDGLPNERLLSEVELPPGADEITVISRGAGRGDVVGVTCADDGSVALYDAELGIVPKVIHGMGTQPFGIAAGTRPTDTTGHGARLYVTAFGQGSVAVVDLPSLDDLTQAQVVLTIGPDENCLNDDVIARPPSCPP